MLSEHLLRRKRRKINTVKTTSLIKRIGISPPTGSFGQDSSEMFINGEISYWLFVIGYWCYRSTLVQSLRSLHGRHSLLTTLPVTSHQFLSLSLFPHSVLSAESFGHPVEKYHKKSIVDYVALAFLFLLSLSIGITGYLGGELVMRYGVGVGL